MGRATSGVTGMKFRPGDELLSMSVIRAGASDDERFVFTVTDGGFAKRTHVFEYRQQGRGGLGIKAMKLNEDRGSLVGGLVVTDNDEVIAIKASGQITRSAVAEVPVKGRDTMGVRFVGVGENDSVVVIALNPETTAEAARLADEAPAGDDSNSTSGVVEDDSSLESGPEVRPVTPNGVSDDAGSRRMTVSKGNAEQPTAQAPRGHSSPNRVEVSGDGQQGAPQSPGTPRPQSPATPGLRDQSLGNGTQDRTPTGTANNSPASKAQGQEPTSSNGQSKESLGSNE